MNTFPAILLGVLLTIGTASPAFVAAREPITLDDVAEGLPDITADEPLAAAFSVERAAEYLDRSALNWQKTKKCATCHTNLFYMVARPALRPFLPDSGEVRSFYEDYRKVRWQKTGPTETQGFWPIVIGTGLTFNDAQTTGKLNDVAREVLDIMWTVQREDGGWSTSGFLTDWKGLARSDGQPLDTKTSDGYGTGLVIVIARELGVPADDARIQQGIDWLHANQRESGKWFTRSPVNEAHNLISNVGSAFAILALQACGELPGRLLGQTK